MALARPLDSLCWRFETWGDPLEEKNVELCEERMPAGSHYPNPQDGPKPGRSALPSIL